MIKQLAFAVLTLPLLAGCVSSNSAEANQAEAYARCKYSPGPDARDKCMKTELALIQARERQRAQNIADDRADAEQRQSVLEAQGVSRDDAKQTVDSGLGLPD